MVIFDAPSEHTMEVVKGGRAISNKLCCKPKNQRKRDKACRVCCIDGTIHSQQLQQQ